MSLRWRLSLSYAAISLLATFSLGIVLLLSLQSNYRRQEANYLNGNAEALGTVIETLILSEAEATATVSPDFIQAALDTYAFLLQARITLKDIDGAIVVQSQPPEELQAMTDLSLRVEMDGITQAFGQTVQPVPAGSQISSFYTLQGSSSAISATETISGDAERSFASPLALMETPGLAPGLLNPASAQRSDFVARTQLYDVAGRPLGTLELSDGPAFGREVLANVSLAFTLAGAVALILSVAAGAGLSRQISRPIQELADKTTMIAAGDLSVRSDVDRTDEIGQLAQGFNEMAARVERLVATLRQFVADAAHELNTPLTALKTNIELAQRGTEPASHLAAASVQLERLTQLNDNLLRLSQIEAGMKESARERIDLRKLLAERSEYYAAQAEQAEVELAVSLPDAPIYIDGSRSQLLQAIDNLIDNGVKFTPAGGQMQLALRSRPAQAEITVSDNGIGLDGARPEELLERFSRGSNVGEINGSGLGLAIAQAAVQQHKGRIRLEELAPGTRVTVTLPVGDIKANGALMTPLVQNRPH